MSVFNETFYKHTTTINAYKKTTEKSTSVFMDTNCF